VTFKRNHKLKSGSESSSDTTIIGDVQFTQRQCNDLLRGPFELLVSRQPHSLGYRRDAESARRCFQNISIINLHVMYRLQLPKQGALEARYRQSSTSYVCSRKKEGVIPHLS